MILQLRGIRISDMNIATVIFPQFPLGSIPKSLIRNYFHWYLFELHWIEIYSTVIIHFWDFPWNKPAIHGTTVIFHELPAFSADPRSPWKTTASASACWRGAWGLSARSRSWVGSHSSGAAGWFISWFISETLWRPHFYDVFFFLPFFYFHTCFQCSFAKRQRYLLKDCPWTALDTYIRQWRLR